MNITFGNPSFVRLPLPVKEVEVEVDRYMVDPGGQLNLQPTNHGR